MKYSLIKQLLRPLIGMGIGLVLSLGMNGISMNGSGSGSAGPDCSSDGQSLQLDSNTSLEFIAKHRAKLWSKFLV